MRSNSRHDRGRPLRLLTGETIGRRLSAMRFNLSRFVHVAAAGALMLGLAAFDGLRAPDVLAREAAAIPGTFVSEVVISNPGNVDANVSLTFVKADGTQAMAAPISLVVKALSS